MRFETHNHKNALRIIPSAISKQVSGVITSAHLRKPVDTQRIRNSILEPLQNDGWSDAVRVAPKLSQIGITSVKSNIGLCLQTGNMSRFYADLLKLQTLFIEEKIKAAICVVPKRDFAKIIGDNIANYERLVKELNIFNQTITIPILIYGIEE